MSDTRHFEPRKLPERDLLCVGLAVADIFVSPVGSDVFAHDSVTVEPPRFLCGGDALNQAIIATRLGLRCDLAGMVGDDFLGNHVVKNLRAEGVGTDFLQVSKEFPTSSSVILSEPDGERHFLATRGASSHYVFEDYQQLGNYRAVSIGSLWGLGKLDGDSVSALLHHAKSIGVITAADLTEDLAGIGTLPIFQMLPDIDYFFPSLEEGTALTGEREPERIIQKLSMKGGKTIVLKLGKDGCLVKHAHGMFHQPALNAQVKDTTGAGDNFVAAYLCGVLLGKQPEECARLGCAAGAFCVESYGATTDRYSYDQLEAVCDRNGNE